MTAGWMGQLFGTHSKMMTAWKFWCGGFITTMLCSMKILWSVVWNKCFLKSKPLRGQRAPHGWLQWKFLTCRTQLTLLCSSVCSRDHAGMMSAREKWLTSFSMRNGVWFVSKHMQVVHCNWQKICMTYIYILYGWKECAWVGDVGLGCDNETSAARTIVHIKQWHHHHSA